MLSSVKEVLYLIASYMVHRRSIPFYISVWAYSDLGLQVGAFMLNGTVISDYDRQLSSLTL